MGARPSLSLQAYRALARRASPSAQDLSTPRPDGDLVWCHLGSTVDVAAVLDLAERILYQRPDTAVLLTLPPEMAAHWRERSVPKGVILGVAPDEHPKSVTSFLDHWQPDIALWIWGNLRPNLVDEAARRSIPLHLVSADTAGFDGRRDRWVPELARHLIRSFQTATARNAAAAQRLALLGLASEQITIQPRLRASGRILPCDSSDLDEMTAQLAGRPVWLAAQTAPEEWGQVLSAHKTTLRGAHRLLLVLEPAKQGQIAALRKLLEASEMNFAIWGDGEWPDETTQVLIADLPDELGLWYRIATVSFLGNSFAPGPGGTDPLPAAALGTAILYGPHVRHHLPRYTRLANAGAARIVNDAGSLAAAVGHLIAPDNAASMAHAGWDVTSEGAAVIDALAEKVQDTLDHLARPR